MKRVLYISNIEVPYRVQFFNQLAAYCELTVLYESRGTQRRDSTWAKREEKQYRVFYLGKGMLPLLRVSYDTMILGCYHTPAQIVAALLLHLLRKNVTINLDGEPFLEGSGWKCRAKRFLLGLADSYLVAGETAARSLRKAVGNKPIVVYPFSSLTEEELHTCPMTKKRGETVLVVGQYAHYKGLDVALEAARRDPSVRYTFVGMGSRTEKFCKEQVIPSNVNVVPFLQKQALYREYARCALLVLPSRRECWGLVVNEAAAFGTPIVSTWGSGAAVEFLAERYPQFLANPADADSLLHCIHLCLQWDREEYGAFLREKARHYSIEASVQAHWNMLEGGKE